VFVDVVPVFVLLMYAPNVLPLLVAPETEISNARLAVLAVEVLARLNKCPVLNPEELITNAF
jgi:hypothetical protein